MPRKRFPMLGVIWGGTLFFGVLQVRGEDAPVSQPPCEGQYQKQRLSPDDLNKVLADHKVWAQEVRDGKVKLDAPDERRANLCGANLFDADLPKANLFNANLQKTDLSYANLQGADLAEANLQGADLGRANLREASLYGANLQGAILGQADLQEADLQGAQLQNASLVRTNLQGADLVRANLQGAYLDGADLQKTYLDETDFREAMLGNVNFHEARLRNTNLQKTILSYANFQGAELYKANLQGADLREANLSGAFFETLPESLPVVYLAAQARGLSDITFTLPFAAVELREAFKKAGLRESQRQLTRAINYRQTHPAMERGNIGERIEARFRWLMFEKTCEYGWFPGRPLRILGVLLLVFAVPYRIALSARGPAGIWAIWSPDRVHKSEGQDTPVRVTNEFDFSRFVGTRWEHPIRELRSLWIALYFSLLSAFHLGWRELNVGTWISRIQPREYTLRATGWVRVVAGIQSLLSVYLVALWVLTYFGNPFE